MEEITINQKIAENYWVNKLANFNIRFYGRDTPGQEQKNEVFQLKIEKKLMKNFLQITGSNPFSEFVIFTSLYYILLYRYFYHTSIILVTGNPAGRLNASGKRKLYLHPGSYHNLTFKELAYTVKTEFEESVRYQDYDEDKLTQRLRDYNSGLEPTPFFGISYDAAVGKSGTFQGSELNLFIEDMGDSWNLALSFKPGSLEPFIAIQFLNNLQSLMMGSVYKQDVPVAQIEILTEKERQTITRDFNDTVKDFPSDKTIVDLFEEQVSKNPCKIALEYGKIVMTYKELNEKANQLSQYFIRKGLIKQNDIAGIFLPKSADAILALLAVLKAGGVYLPIATDYPEKRIRYIVEDSGMQFLITNDLHLSKIATAGVHCINLDEIILSDEDNKNPAIISLPEDLAYVIYTSGTTGSPKGVMIEHKSFINMSLDQVATFCVSEKDNVLLFASLSFDASLSEIFMTLFSGACLVIPDDDIIREKEKIVTFMHEKQISLVTFPPAYLPMFSQDELSTLRCIITAGEPAHAEKALECAQTTSYFNAYGPTECSVCVSIYQVTNQDEGKYVIPIGKPIANLSVFILDENYQVVPIGVTGKIYVSGVGLSRGYLNKKDLSADSFFPSPFKEGERLYKTGDLGRWLPGGVIEFSGRLDDQVKIRGYRVEMGEIEGALRSHSEIADAVVMALDPGMGTKELTAYIVCDSTLQMSEVRRYLEEQLPAYMIPVHYIRLETLPLTLNGKVEKKDLPLPSRSLMAGIAGYIAPRNKTESKLVQIWEDVLGADRVGVKDNFFELGGHSLKAIRLASRIYKEFEVRLGLRQLFASAVLEKQAELVDSALRTSFVNIASGREEITI